MPNLRMEDIRINYEMEGAGPPIVLVHGHGSNLHFYDDLTESLMNDYTVIRYDQRGYGLTDKPTYPPYSTELWTDDLHKFLTGLGIRRAIVVGHSMGGRVCATLSANQPNTTAALITLNTTWFGSNSKVARELEEISFKVEKEGMTVALETSRSYRSIAERLTRVRDEEKGRLLRNDPESYALGMRAVAQDFKSGSRDDILNSIECPTLILIGDRDSAPLQGSIAMFRKIRDSRLAVVPGAGHYSLLEKPEISTSLIVDFLGEISARLNS